MFRAESFQFCLSIAVEFESRLREQYVMHRFTKRIDALGCEKRQKLSKRVLVQLRKHKKKFRSLLIHVTPLMTTILMIAPYTHLDAEL